jgi:hypothetical protein
MVVSGSLGQLFFVFRLYICRVNISIWYNDFMDEKNFLQKNLRVLEKTKEMLEREAKNQAASSSAHITQGAGHTNPISKKMMKFHNEKIGDKLSVKDLLR